MLFKLSAVAGALLVLVVGAVALAQQPSSSTEFTPSGARATAKVLAVPEDQANSFSVLRRVGEDTDRVDAAWVAGGKQLFGLNIALARRTRTNPDLYLVPGRRALCLAGPDSPTVCGPEAKARAGHLIGASQCGGLRSGEAAIFGVLPDGARDATLHSAGASSPLSVTDNAYYVRLDVSQAVPDWVEFDLGGSHQAVHVPLPAGAGSTQCDTGTAGP